MRTRTDEEIRREVLAASGLTPAEVERWLADKSKPDPFVEQGAIVHERLLDLAYALVSAIGLRSFMRWQRIPVTPWVAQRDDR